MDRILRELHADVLAPVASLLHSTGNESVAFIVGGSLGLLSLHVASYRVDMHERYVLDDLDVIYAFSAAALRHCLSSTLRIGPGNHSRRSQR